MKLKDLNPETSIESFFANFEKFLASKVRNQYIGSDDEVISVYARKGHHYVGDSVQLTLDIARIEIDPKSQGKGIGTAIVNGVHGLNPFPVTFIESILNTQFYNRLKKQDWLDVENSNPPSVYKVK